MNVLIETITSKEPKLRNRPFIQLASALPREQLIKSLSELEAFRKKTTNLYERVRSCLFLYYGFRFVLANDLSIPLAGTNGSHRPEGGDEQAISGYWKRLKEKGIDAPLSAALAHHYHALSFRFLAGQVRRSVRASKGNQWMFRVGHRADHPIKIKHALFHREEGQKLYPILAEYTPVRMDLSHSGWSDIFFLGMDYPEGARVINVSIDLGVYQRDAEILPPISSYIRVIPEPVLRLTSLDLNATKDIKDLGDLFNFGNDYLSLLKAGVIASGLIPPSFEGTGQPLDEILGSIVSPGMGLELVTKVNDIPKGSRFAVSTNLLASMISVLMRATGQTENMEGSLNEIERRLVASRAILGEWIGGSGGGWQDSGGVWPGIKVITGAIAQEGDPEFGISRGCLLPQHRILEGESLHEEMYERLAKSLVLMHGGMAQNVGPILEMVTEKYLLRAPAEWDARQSMFGIFDGILDALRDGDVKALASCTEENFFSPIKTIIPWASTHFTELIVKEAKRRFGADYWGFLMMGGMSGGGMGMFVNPKNYALYKQQVLEILGETKAAISDSLPFAMDPVVYDFKINPHGTQAALLKGPEALMPNRYYSLQVSTLVKLPPESISYLRRAEIDYFTSLPSREEDAVPLLRNIVNNLFQASESASQDEKKRRKEVSTQIKAENGFDAIQHEQLRESMRQGQIGLARNRLPLESVIEEVDPNSIGKLDSWNGDIASATKAIQEGRVGIMTLAAGLGSRWTSGAGIIKALNSFVEIDGLHRSFLELHLMKTRKVAEELGADIPHIIATSHLTHQGIEEKLWATQYYGYEGSVYLSPSRSIGQRFLPMARDLSFLWEAVLQPGPGAGYAQKVAADRRANMINWVRKQGEGEDYTMNLPNQQFSPMGHWYEISNLIRNGMLAKILKKHPKLSHLLMHSIDNLGTQLAPEPLSYHLEQGNGITFELIPRWPGDQGGALASVNGQLRLVEDLAFPTDGMETQFSFLPTLSSWIDIDALLDWFKISRDDLSGPSEVLDEAVRMAGRRMPTYIAIKEVKYRWGHGQEDIHPVAQVEKLWTDMSMQAGIPSGYLLVNRYRGESLRDPAQLDPWANDGSLAYIKKLCGF